MKKNLLVAAMLLCALTISARPYTHSIGVNVGNIYGVSYKGYVSENLVVIADLNVKLGASKGYSWATSYSDKDYQKQLKDAGYKLSGTDKDLMGKSYPFAYWTFEANPNFAYQGLIANAGFASIHWFAGAGISLGCGQYAHYGYKRPKSSGDSFSMEDLEGLEDYFVASRKGSASSYGGVSVETVTLGMAYKDMADARDNYNELDSDHKKYAENPIGMKLGLNAIGGVEFCFKGAPLALSVDFRPGWGEFISFQKYPMDNDKDCLKVTGAAFFDWALGASLRYCF
jgi:hypothetical protein